MALRVPLVVHSSGYHEEIPTTDAISAVGGATFGADVVMTSHKVTGLASATTAGDALAYGQTGASLAQLSITLAPSSANHAVTKGYVDGVAQGLSVKSPARAASGTNLTLSGLQTIDGVTLATSDRVLLLGQTSAVQNGLWVAAVGAWTRPDDFAAGQHAAGTFCFVQEGTTYGDAGWVCTKDRPNDVVGTDTLTWAQFTGAGTVTNGAGLNKTGNEFSVRVNAAGGTAIVANDVSVKLSATTPGLQLAADGLAMLFDPNGGLTAGVAGSRAKLNGTTLLSGASGLSVKGLPANFEIANTVVGNDVTAENLTALMDGSDASGLHTHLDLMTPSHAETAAEALALGDPVYASATNGQVGKARADTDAKAWVVGVAKAAASALAPVSFSSSGRANGVLSGATAGTPYYLQATGGIGTALPASGNRVIQVGFALSATDLFVRISDFGKRA